MAKTSVGGSFSRRDFLKIAGVTAGAAAASGALPLDVLGAKPKFDTPTITCVGETQHTIFLQVCAGGSGAPAGFSVQWVKHRDYPSLTCGAGNDGLLWPPSDTTPNLCKASFSGTPGCSIYSPAPNACVTVEIGNLVDSECGVGLSNCGADELDCGPAYVFRAFAHANSSRQRSGFTANLCCSTEPCTVTVVFNVTVPASTDGTGRSVYIAGTLNGWNPSLDSLSRIDATHWTITLQGQEGTVIEYKYTLGEWGFVEEDTSCDEIANRQLILNYGSTGTQIVSDVVANWRNVSPCGS